ncbi:hypothetical protein YC2023_018372 [Brassica napus]
MVESLKLNVIMTHSRYEKGVISVQKSWWSPTEVETITSAIANCIQDIVPIMPETFIRDPDSIRDPIRKSGYPERLNPDPDSKMLDPSKPNPDPDIFIF